MRNIMLFIFIAVSVVITVPRNQREASSLLIRSGLRIIELGLALAPHKPRQIEQEEFEPDSPLEDAAVERAPRDAPCRQT